MARQKGCSHSARLPVEPRLPYNEISHEVGGNFLSVRVDKNIGRIKPVGGFPDDSGTPRLQARCEDGRGNKCRPGCAKVNVIPNQAPPPKLPDEEMFLLRASRQLLHNDEMRNVLEIELRTPRNYEPLPEPPPPPPPIQVAPAKKGKGKAKGKAKAQGAKKKKKKKK